MRNHDYAHRVDHNEKEHSQPHLNLQSETEYLIHIANGSCLRHIDKPLNGGGKQTANRREYGKNASHQAIKSISLNSELLQEQARSVERNAQDYHLAKLKQQGVLNDSLLVGCLFQRLIHFDCVKVFLVVRLISLLSQELLSGKYIVNAAEK